MMRVTVLASAVFMLATSSSGAQIFGLGRRDGDTGLRGDRQTFNSGGSSRLVAVDPSERYRDGVTALNAGKFRDAQRAFRDVLGREARDPSANFLMGVSLASDAKLKDSHSYFERAVRNKHDFTEARTWLGVTYAKAGETKKADAQRTALTEINADCAGLCADAAVIGAALKRVEEAIANPATPLPPLPKIAAPQAPSGAGR